MAKMIVKPKLSLGNQLYLYRLLRDALGCGKQTLMPVVEDTLAKGDMAAVDLGFENTRELLEALESCIQLTVFKGGRIYATVIAQPTWDEALAAGETKQKPSGKGAKSWKKKKADKTLKAVKPKHVKRPESESVAAAEPAVGSSPAADEASTPTATESAECSTQTDESASEHAAEIEVEIKNETVFTIEDEQALAATDADAAIGSGDEPETVATAHASSAESTHPAISLTVIYDPEHSNAGIQTIESNPDAINELRSQTTAESNAQADPETLDESEQRTEAGTVASLDTVAAAAPAHSAQAEGNANAPEPSEPAKASTHDANDPKHGDNRKHEAKSPIKAVAEAAAQTAPEPKPKHEAKPAPGSAPKTARHQSAAAPQQQAAPTPAAPAKPVTPKIPEGYPIDFTTEVFCPGTLLSDLSQLLPYGADVLGIAGEYYWIARENGTIDAQRNRATFPLRYTRDGKRHEVSIRIRRNTEGGMGANWSIDKIRGIE